MFFPTPFPGGVGALIATLAWLAIGSLSAVAVFVALVLAPVARAAAVAQVLSRIALWGGVLAVVLAIIPSVLSTIDLKDSPQYSQNLVESALAISLTCLIPLGALVARFWSRRTLRRTPLATNTPTS